MNERIPWDIYVDERRVPGDSALGFLAVPNTASFAHKLFRCRQNVPVQGRVETRELHWQNLHRGVLPVALKWVECVHQHKGARFSVLDWPREQSKEAVVLRFLGRFCRRLRLVPPFNIVVFLDHDSGHAKSRIQNTIRESGQVSRCYHLDGARNDCLQCCDLLLGAMSMLRVSPDVRAESPELVKSAQRGVKLTNSAVKRLLAGHVGGYLEAIPKSLFDFRGVSSE
ncbi:MAG: hypothetical protein ACKVZJ_14670 [Phycisphaerales bacterium]